MAEESLNEFPDSELDPYERRKVRRMLRENELTHGLWKFLFKSVVVVTAVAGFAAAVKGYIVDLAKYIAK